MTLVEEIEAEIQRRTHGRRYLYPEGERGVDARAWAEEAARFGFGADWAVDWINTGQPQPMEWIRRLDASHVEAATERAKAKTPTP
jgi:hypothetical protein